MDEYARLDLNNLKNYSVTMILFFIAFLVKHALFPAPVRYPVSTNLEIAGFILTIIGSICWVGLAWMWPALSDKKVFLKPWYGFISTSLCLVLDVYWFTNDIKKVFISFGIVIGLILVALFFIFIYSWDISKTVDKIKQAKNHKFYVLEDN